MTNIAHGGSPTLDRSAFAPLAHVYMILSEIIHSVPAFCDPWKPIA